MFICNFIETILKNFVKMHWLIIGDLGGRHFTKEFFCFVKLYTTEFDGSSAVSMFHRCVESLLFWTRIIRNFTVILLARLAELFPSIGAKFDITSTLIKF